MCSVENNSNKDTLFETYPGITREDMAPYETLKVVLSNGDLPL